MNHRNIARRLVAPFVAAVCVAFAGCSTTGSNSLTCASTEIAPSTQPGSTDPQRALDWYLANGNSSLPRDGFERSGSTKTRVVYSDGANQISVGRLPTETGQPQVWVVLMTYECS